MGYPRTWYRPTLERIRKTNDTVEGRALIMQQLNELNLGEPVFQFGIERDFVDRTYGMLDGELNNRWPVSDSYVVLPHLVVQRPIHKPLRATAWSTKSNFDDSIGVASVIVGNPLG